MIYSFIAITAFTLGFTASIKEEPAPEPTVKEVYVWGFERDWRLKYES